MQFQDSETLFKDNNHVVCNLLLFMCNKHNNNGQKFQPKTSFLMDLNFRLENNAACI